MSEKFEISPKNLLKRYGVAYLASSITLSLCSYTLFYELLKRGLDVEGCLSAIGISVPQSKYYGAAALAYALHKAASPIRFPPTLFLTQVLGRLIGKKVSAEDEAATRALWHKLFAPAFCIGYFHGTRARVITSWSVTTIIFFVVIAVRKLANPYRAIIDVSWSHLILLKLSSPIYLKIYHGDVVEHILSTRHLWQIYTICRRLTFVDVLHCLELCSFQDDGFEFKWFNFGIWWALMGFWGWSDRGTFMGHRVGSAIVHTIPPGRNTPGLWSLLARRHTISSLNLGISWKKDYAAGAFSIFKHMFWVSLLDSLGWNPSIASLQTGWLDHTWSYLIHLTQAALPIWLSPMTRGRIRNPIQLILPATWRYSMLDRWPSTLSGLASMILEEVELCFWFYSSLKYLNCPNLIEIVTIYSVLQFLYSYIILMDFYLIWHFLRSRSPVFSLSAPW